VVQDRRVQSLFPTVPNELSYDDLAELYAYPVERTWLRSNFVTSLDGAAQGPDLRSGTLSSRADKRVFGLLRTLADVIIVGASTTRAEGYLPVTAGEMRTAIRRRLGLAPLPTIAVVSRSLRLDPGLLSGGDAATVVITTEAAPAGLREEIAASSRLIVAGEADVDLDLAVDALAASGFQRMLCEGGPSLMRSLVAAGRVDEICLTVSPVVVGGNVLRMTSGDAIEPPADYRLRHLLEDDSQLFYRYTRT
jgi:riboflavin biosynthesis pyrimidine reductase